MPRSARSRWTLAATILASSMAFIDGTVVNVALPALQTDLHATMTDVQWVIEAYALCLGGLILVGGSFGDQFGRRRVFLAGLVLFTVASVFCGLSPSPGALVAGRAIQGIGAALVTPASLAIISAAFDDRERGRAIGAWSGWSAITTAIGPVTGGWLIEHVSWRAVFFLNVPIAAAAVALTVRFVDESRDPTRTGAVDWAGAGLAVAGLGGVVFALLEWPPLGPGHPLVLGTLAVGLASLAALLIVERRRPNAMLPLDLFRSRAFALANGLTLLLYAALGITLFLVPMRLIQVDRYSATAAGAALLPFPILMFTLSRWSGGLVARVGGRLPLTIGPAIAAVGLLLYARLRLDSTYWAGVLPAVMVLGLGMAVTVSPLTTTVMGAADTRHAGVASGINNAVARVAGLLAIAVFGVMLSAIFAREATRRLDALRLAPAARAGIDRQLPRMAGADLREAEPLAAPDRAAARGAIDAAFAAAFRRVMIAAAGLALLAAAAGAALR
jgi:EmrB/QacA subfamily drug resistance transporter